jgi:hypothetical protein
VILHREFSHGFPIAEARRYSPADAEVADRMLESPDENPTGPTPSRSLARSAATRGRNG